MPRNFSIRDAQERGNRHKRAVLKYYKGNRNLRSQGGL